MAYSQLAQQESNALLSFNSTMILSLFNALAAGEVLDDLVLACHEQKDTSGKRGVMRHRPVRLWWLPWRKRCHCGCSWFPCPDAVTVQPPPIVDSRGRRQDSDWNWPTASPAAVTKDAHPLSAPRRLRGDQR